MYVISAGSTGSNEGKIYMGIGAVNLGVPQTIYNSISIGYNYSLSTCYTIPSGYTGYITQASFATNLAKESIFVILVREYNSVFQTRHIQNLYQIENIHTFITPLRVPEKSDISIRAKCAQSNATVNSTIDIILVKND